jgi:hypothetical protein
MIRIDRVKVLSWEKGRHAKFKGKERYPVPALPGSSGDRPPGELVHGPKLSLSNLPGAPGPKSGEAGAVRFIRGKRIEDALLGRQV